MLRRHTTAIRVALGYLTLSSGLVAVSILVAPRSFYDDFPAGPGTWVSAQPPYNEHLIRDFGAAGLGLAIVTLLAAVWLDRRLVQAAAIAMFAGTLPHAIYHSTTTEALSAIDNVGTLGALYLQALLPLAVLYLATGARQEPPAGEQGRPRWRPRAARAEAEQRTST
jgi:tellurite resistance protein TehA-like permease